MKILSRGVACTLLALSLCASDALVAQQPTASPAQPPTDSRDQRDPSSDDPSPKDGKPTQADAAEQQQSASKPAEAQQVQPRLSRDRDGQQSELRFDIPRGKSSPVYPLFLHLPSDETVTDLSVELMLLDDGAAVTEVTLQTGLDANTRLPRVDVKQPTPLYLKVANLQRFGTFQGEGIVQYSVGDQKRTARFPIVVSRSAAASLSLHDEADADTPITLNSASENAVFPLTLRETAGNAGGEIQVTLGPIARTDGADSSLASLSADSPTYRIKPNGYAVIRLKATLPESATYRSWIMLSDGERPLMTRRLVIERKPPKFEVGQADADGKLTLVISRSTFDHPLLIKLAADKPGVNDLQVTLGPLIREDQQPLDGAAIMMNSKGPQKLVSGGVLTARISGKQMQPGKYHGQLLLTSQQQTQAVSLIIERKTVEQEVEVADLGAAAGTVLLPLVTATARVPISISEPSGRVAMIYHPEVESLKRINDNVSFQVAPSQLELLHRVRGRLVPAPGGDKADQVVRVPPKGTQTYVVRVNQLAAGKYQGKLVVHGPDVKRVAKDFELFVRHAWYLALLPILAGVAGSFYLRRYTTSYRRKLLDLANLKRVREAVQDDAARHVESSEEGVWTRLLTRLQELEEDLNLGKAERFTERLDQIRRRRELNIKLHRSTVDAQRVLDAFPDDLAAEREAARHSLAAKARRVREALRKKGGEGLGDEEAPKWLSEYGVLIESTRNSIVLAPATQLKAELSRIKQEEGESESINVLLADIDELIDVANSGGFEGAVQSLRELYQRFINWRVDALRDALATMLAARPDARRDQEEWKAFDEVVATLRRQLDDLQQLPTGSSDAIPLLRRAGHHLRRAAVEQLHGLAHSPTPDDIPPEEQNKWRRLARPVDQHLKAARNAGLNTIERALATARRAFVEMQVERLNLRVDQLKKTLRQPPERLDDPNVWTAELAADQPLGRMLTQLTVYSLADGGDLTRQQQLAIFNADWLDKRIAALRVACEAGIRQLPDAASEWETVADELGRAERSRDLFDQAAGDARQVKFRDADLAGVEAQLAYLAVVQTQPKKDSKLAIFKAHHQTVPVAGAVAGPADQMVADIQLPDHAVNARLASAAAPTEAMSSAETVKLIRTYDNYVELLTIAIAAVGGLLALWVKDYDWGTTFDYLTALLWGFGVHEAGTNIITNLTDMKLWPKEE